VNTEPATPPEVRITLPLEGPPRITISHCANPTDEARIRHWITDHHELRTLVQDAVRIAEENRAA